MYYTRSKKNNALNMKHAMSYCSSEAENVRMMVFYILIAQQCPTEYIKKSQF